MKYSLTIPRAVRREWRSPRWRKVRASWRDTLILLREFGWPLFLFTLAMIGGGLWYHQLALQAGQALSSQVEAIYLVLSLTFLQSAGDFPSAWYLQIFYFVMPLVGIGILAQGLADFGVVFFNRRARGKEWEMAVASTFSNHVILIGLGHLGFRVMGQLCSSGQDVVVIELDPKADLLASAQESSVPVIQEDGASQAGLTAAGVERARSIVICTQNDSLNLKIAFRARRLNPDINVVVRIFDYDFAAALKEQFGFQAMSATGMSAPAFAAAAAGVEITPSIAVEGEPFSLASMEICAHSRLIGLTVSEIEQRYDVSVVLVRQNKTSDFHPAGDRSLALGDVLAVLGGPGQLTVVADHNRP